MVIYHVNCLTEDGTIESNGYFFNKENAKKCKDELDKQKNNLHYGIKQNINEIEMRDSIKLKQQEAKNGKN